MNFKQKVEETTPEQFASKTFTYQQERQLKIEESQLGIKIDKKLKRSLV